MKKITLLFMMLAVSFGYAQTLPFDFQGTLHGFIGDGGPGVTNGSGNDVLEITAGVSDWDNAQVTFASPIDLSDAANNTLRFTIQSTTAAAGEVHQHGVSFQGGGGALEANFQTTGTDVLNVELNFNAGLGSREKLVIFTDVGDLGGIAATPNVAGMNTASLSGTYIIDNISLGFDPGTCSDGVLNNGETAIDCGGPNCTPCAADVTPPTAFTAVLGTVGGTSVELLLNATDDLGGDITYDVTYDGGGTAQTTGASGVEKSLIISGLTSETMYTFMVSASDAAANPAANNAISVPATTSAIIALPFNFEGTLHGFIGDGGPGVTNGAGNDVLEITAGVSDWDNAQVTFTDPIDLSNEFNNTLRFTIQSTTAAAGEVHQHGVSFQGGGGALEANFQTVGTDVLNVELNFNAGLGSREKMIIFTDVGDLGGIAATPNQAGMNTASLSGTYIIDNISLGADPETCDDGIMNQDETDIDCGGANCLPCDVTAPTAFTAAAGTIGAFSVELLLNATDDSAGTITYDISYNGGANTVQTTGDSGVETSFSVGGLMENTAYTFEVSASDAAGNSAANNAITVMATTVVDTSTPCAGFSNEALEGSWSQGINYTFVTSGTDVTVTFEVLDTDKPGLNPEIFVEPSTFLPMDQSGAPTYTYIFTGQTDGTDLMFSLRAAYAGGLVRSKIFTYTVGDDCAALANDDCASASVLNVGILVNGDTTNATDSGVAAGTCGAAGGDQDIWYSFTATAQMVTDGANFTTDADHVVVYSGDCTTPTEIACLATGENTPVLVDGTTYLVRVYNSGIAKVAGPTAITLNEGSLSTRDFNSNSIFSYYPNPINNTLTLNAQQAISNVTVFNMLGQEVIKTAPDAVSNNVDMSNLQSGAYFVQVTVGTAVETVRVIKN